MLLKVLRQIAGSAPTILAFILYDHYVKNGRPVSQSHIRIPSSVRAVWELAFLIVVAGSLGITLINLTLYSCFKCLSTRTWPKRFDSAYFTLGGTAQATVGFIMVGSALSSSEEEPIELKYAAGVNGRNVVPLISIKN